jgi:hypothetical protein
LHRATVRAAGNLAVEHGRLLRLSPHSGHYMPTTEDIAWVLALLARRGVDLTHVHVDPLKGTDSDGGSAAR